MNCVTYPPPSAICGKTGGDEGGRLKSTTGKVVSRKSPRLFVRERRVNAAKGDSEEISNTPVKSLGRPGISWETNLAEWPL
jgi:hypothetical protein